MITDEDAKELIERLCALSTKHKASANTNLFTYAKGQHDGRKDAYALAAVLIEEKNHGEVNGE